MVICRDAAALATAMNSDAVYLSGAHDAQKNLNLEFSRRARGIPCGPRCVRSAAPAWPRWSSSIARRRRGSRTACGLPATTC